jgi:peptidoglycan biosynthesis protein MviN/MurJ (putative lipid II flippase)
MVAFRHRMAFGLRGILAIIIPSAVGMVILAHPLIDLVLAHGAETTTAADSTAATLAMFSLGLPGFCTFLYAVRVFQAMQDTKTAFRLYLVENGVNIVAGVLLVGPLGVRGLALSVSIAYTLAAILALSVVRQRVGGLGGDDLTTPIKRVVGATAVMALATVLALSVSGAQSGLALLGRVVLAVVVGATAYVATAAALGARQARRTADARTHRAPRPEMTEPPMTEPPMTDERTVDDRPSAEWFRGRLGDHPRDQPTRHLRPVGGGEGGPGDDVRPEDDEEDSHGPDSGGDR